MKRRRGVIIIRTKPGGKLTAPLQELAFAVRHNPGTVRFYVTWDVGEIRDYSGLIVYDHSKRTVEVFNYETWGDGAKRTHLLFSGVSEAILRRAAQAKEVTGEEGTIFDVVDNLVILSKLGCPKKTLESKTLG